MLDPTVMEYAIRLREMEEERNLWIKHWNRLERHVSRHFEKKSAGFFCDDVDDQLHGSWRKELTKVGASPSFAPLPPDSMGP